MAMFPSSETGHRSPATRDDECLSRSSAKRIGCLRIGNVCRTPVHSGGGDNFMAMHFPFLRGREISPRVVVAGAAFCMQLALGAVYGWSVFLNPLREHFAAGKSETTLAFTITLAVLGLPARFCGGLPRRIGPRATATIAGVLYGCGVMLSGFAPNLGVLYLCYGVLGGIGLGLGYIIPLAVLIKWFPDRRGFITGFAVTGFGLGALVTSPL